MLLLLLCQIHLLIKLQIPKFKEAKKQEVDKGAELPISHIKMLSEKEKSKLEKEILDLQKQIEQIKNTKANDNFGDGLAKNQKINEMTEKLFELKDNEFFAKSNFIFFHHYLISKYIIKFSFLL